ncbi:YigZ family protein [Pediococcus damnosus]|nr:YigZ family protein [Pediococcus damnosus]KRN47574.1 IMPACT family member yvyE [Pediococcus damnosus]
MDKHLITIAQNGSHELDIKKSRFIANAFRIQTEEEAQKFIQEIKTQHHKANHHCFAYLLGNDDHIQRASDDGEPSGTAGVPILEVLQKNNVHNTLVVVTRYFGGIKLGAGGLIRAYSNSTSQVLTEIGLVELVSQIKLSLTIEYAQHDSLVHWLDANHFKVSDSQYGEKVTVQVPVAEPKITEFETTLTNLFSGNIAFQKLGTQFNEVP